jgi:hypothetical protein
MALTAAWISLVAGLSYFYVDNLIHPACSATPAIFPGYQPLLLEMKDGAKLRGWYRAPQNGAVILLLAGNGGSRDAMLAEASLLARHGYGSMTLEYRSCAGGISSLGYHEAGDVSEMVEYALAQPGVRWLGVIGFSAGGAAAILSAPDNPEIQAVVAEGNYYTLDYEIRNAPAAPLTLEWQIQQLVILWFRALVGVWPSHVNPAEILPHISPRPLLLIVGESEMSNNRGEGQFQAALPPRELWVVAGAGHGGYFQTEPQEYEARIIRFLDDARK